MNKIIKILVYVCRFLLAATFLFSGFVKAVDPLGTTYKIEDYFTAFGSFFELFVPMAFVLSLLLIGFEFVLGFNLLFGIAIKRTKWLTLLLMLFMTPLTLYIALKNPVSDCGCFGDALVLDNWQTFYKNIVLLVMTLFYVWKSDFMTPFLAAPTRFLMEMFAIVSLLLLSLHCYFHLPVLDFRPYKIGTYIPEKMIIPDGAPQDEYETIFVYEKDGQQKEFLFDGVNMPDVDSTWTFVDQKSKLLKKGYEPPIHDFSIELEGVGDITKEVLEDKGYTFLLISNKLENAVLRKSFEINRIYQYALENGYPFYCMNSSLEKDREDYRDETGAEYPFATTDNITLKTIVRSNPGLVLIKNGTVLNKWHYNDLPEFDQPLENSPLGEMKKVNNVGTILFIFFSFFVPVFVLIGLDKTIRNIYKSIKNRKK